MQETGRTLSEQGCRQFFEKLRQMDLSWNWDDRFNAALAQFQIESAEAVGKVLEEHLGTAWDSDTIARAPEKVNVFFTKLGGIMTGQLLFVADLPEERMIFCAWWPWGNGQTVSIRVGSHPEDSVPLHMLAVPTGGREGKRL